ncbi:phosphoenolpyruvate--protein phosphotransferase [Sphaerisporangium rubeum]|uniref:Phosphoenolpyruvate-protein phosphotransferase n=1 Tax=Sphaerisporangium rubeum TaxID=321317 RepID=A0A7X0IBL2_9ACTN|nr:phosphoenolpyruvate--protein phosphotransferase [Sphaerisporangium rubeum]MBB6472090.1 phosphotransferase system enzyme I (PtsI) [Sphaerisporangium rubeum]
MTTLTGAGVSPGTGYGAAFLLRFKIAEPAAGSRHDGDPVAETARAEAAVARVAATLEERGVACGGEAEEVLRAQAMMALDPELSADVAGLIDAGVAAERAVYDAFLRFRDVLAEGRGYVAERVADLDDVRDRVIAELTGVPMPGLPGEAEAPYVLVAHDLSPADTATLSRDVVAAFVTERGGPTSHTAILARAMGVPAVVACPGATSIAEGTMVLVDGTAGVIMVGPDEAEVRTRLNGSAPGAGPVETGRTSTGTARTPAAPARTADGRRVPLLANIGGPRDVAAALDNGAEGVGLFRTEMLFLDREDSPSLEEQVAVYREVFEAFPGAPVVVRVLDAGADKPLPFLRPTGDEPNPALGERGIRLFRTYPDVLTTQLQALARAAEDTSPLLQVMAPMVATADEAAWFTALAREAGLAGAGVMIEVPAAALRAHDLAGQTAFFSIGTNDLSQYAFAADRELPSLAPLHAPWHPALLDLIALTAAAGIPTGVCGEAAADPALACVLTGLGATTLSMTPTAVPWARAALAGHTVAQCEAAAAAARRAAAPEDAREAALVHLPGLAEAVDAPADPVARGEAGPS